MPNWCQNSLFLSGPKDVIQEIAETKLSLQKLVPCPQELLETEAVYANEAGDMPTKMQQNQEKYGYKSWYDWCVENWGTKWDVGPVDDLEIFEEDHDKFELRSNFDSAWGPPVAAFEDIYDKYKDRGLRIRLEYLESGNRFMGVAHTTDGSFHDEYRDYSNADELEEYANELDHFLAESEVEYLREIEAEEDQNNSDN